MNVYSLPSVSHLGDHSCGLVLASLLRYPHLWPEYGMQTFGQKGPLISPDISDVVLN